MADKAGLRRSDYIKQCDTACEDGCLSWEVGGDWNRRKYGINGLSSAHCRGQQLNFLAPVATIFTTKFTVEYF